MKTKKQNLTPREKKIIELISQGYTDKEIASKINVSYSSIRNAIALSQLKTSTVNRAQLVSWAYNHKILSANID